MSTTGIHHPPPLQTPLTAADIIHLAKSSSATLPSSIPHSNLLSHLHSSSTPTTTYLSSLLTLISQTPPSPSLSSLISSLLSSFRRLLRSRNVPGDGTEVHHVFHLFSLRLQLLDKSQLISILESLVSDLSEIADSNDALHLDLLPRCIDLAEESAGPFLDDIVAASWSKAVVVKMVSILKEFPLGVRDRASEFLEKAFDGMREVDIQDLPSLVYQLLLLASKGFCRRMVIEGILGFFGEGLAKGAPAIVRQVEGTVLMHMNFAVKQDPSLAQEVMACLRLDCGAFDHFSVLVVLSIAKIRRFNENAISLLRSIVVASYRNYMHARGCKWLSDNSKEECRQVVKCVEKALLRAVSEINYGMEHIVPPIVQLAYVLLECVDGENHDMFHISQGCIGVEELSIQILRTLFEVHDMTRNAIIEHCKFRILTLKPQQCVVVIKLLGFLVKHFPYPMLEYIGHLKELLDYFTFLHGKVALPFVISILTLTKFSHDLQDYIILVLRKALFRREDIIRLAAVNAIICLILEESKSKKIEIFTSKESSSQASCSQQGSLFCRMGFGLFQELNGLLRRCLSQEASVRETMYHGLVRLVILDPLMSGAVCDFLWPHFLPYFREDAEFPLELDACVRLVNDKVCLEEPLDCLLSCVSWILLLHPHKKFDGSDFSRACLGFSLSQDAEASKISCAEAFSNALLRIRKKLRGGTMKDVSRHSSLKTGYCMWILSKILEVFINMVAIELEKAVGVEKEDLHAEVLELVSCYESIEKEKYLDKRQQPATKTLSKNQDIPAKSNNCHHSSTRLFQEKMPFLATSSIKHLLVTAIEMYADGPDGRVLETTELSSCKLSDDSFKLISFALKACHHQIKYFLVQNGDSLECPIVGDITSVGQPLLQLACLLKSELKSERDRNIKESKGKKSSGNKNEHLLLSLTCLKELFNVCTDRANYVELIKKLASFKLPGIMDIEDTGINCKDVQYERDLKNKLQEETRAHNFLEKRMIPLYLEFLACSLLNECQILCDIMVTIANKLAGDFKDLHGIWANSICESIVLKNSKVARGLVGLAISLRLPPHDLIVAHTMATELVHIAHLEDDSMEDSKSYPIINSSTACGIASELLQSVEYVIDDFDWALSKMKVLSVVNHESSGRRKGPKFWKTSSVFLLNNSFYSRSEALVNLLSCFAEMKLKDSQAEQFLKLTAKFYKTLAQMTKQLIAPRGHKQLLPGQEFQKLVEGTCKKLTTPIYNFVGLMQQNQQENAWSRGTIGKIRRENRCIPNLIFQIEDYEKYLIKLSKLTKVNLLRHAKRSTARDFRIKILKKVTTQEGQQHEEPNWQEKVTTEEEMSGAQIQKEPSQASSQNGLDEESVGREEYNGSQKEVACSKGGDPALEDSESDRECRGTYILSKRDRRSNIVEDSDSDG